MIFVESTSRSLGSIALIAILCIGIVVNVWAETLQQDNKHIRRWNSFANKTYELHKKQISGKNIVIKKKKGGYADNPEFYLKKDFFDETGKLLSRVSREINNPQNIHTIEVFVYNNKNQIIRDYVAAYLPYYRNAPTQTLISLHHYNNGLHAFRSFDASSDLILERCEGKYNEKEISILLDEDEIYESLGDKNGIMFTKEYKLCFDGLAQTAGKYLLPQ